MPADEDAVREALAELVEAVNDWVPWESLNPPAREALNDAVTKAEEALDED